MNKRSRCSLLPLATRPARIFFGTGVTNGNSFSANALSCFGTGKTPSPLSGTAFLDDNTSGISRSLTLLGQNQAQTAALLIVMSK